MVRTVAKEFTKHKRMIRLLVILRKTNIFIHIERHNMSESKMMNRVSTQLDILA